MEHSGDVSQACAETKKKKKKRGKITAPNRQQQYELNSGGQFRGSCSEAGCVVGKKNDPHPYSPLMEGKSTMKMLSHCFGPLGRP
jgi:hypothetical protein